MDSDDWALVVEAIVAAGVVLLILFALTFIPR